MPIKRSFVFHLALVILLARDSFGQVPDNLVVEGVPEIPAPLRQAAGRYLEFRAAAFLGWHPKRTEMLISTRFADTPQLHLINHPGGARRQLTFLSEPIRSGAIQPKDGAYAVFGQDTGGGEFYQIYRYDFANGNIVRLTDGKSRNAGAQFSKSGKWLAYTSTRRNGRDTDIYIVNPAEPASDRLLLQVQGGGWSVADWSWDDTQLLLIEYISINESYVHVADVRAGTKKLITPKEAGKAAYAGPRFSRDAQSMFVATDQDTEFLQLVRVDFASGKHTPLTRHISWDVDEFALAPDGKTIAFITNEDGVGKLHWVDAKSGREKTAPKIPVGVPTGLEWHENGQELGFTFTSARTASDAYSVDVKSGHLTRWTESETGGLDASTFAEPALIKWKSFDGLPISAFLYRPGSKAFPGRRPVLCVIHGGPEGQTRPRFLSQYNYLLNEMGVALIFPNVRGSSGYGKTFLSLDNGFKREDSVKDIGSLIQWAQHDPQLDPERIAVMGGSYGGYMTLASMVHFNDQLRCGIDVVGISNFKTFLKNTQDYRKDLRRVEYGDERDPAMSAFLERIAPFNHAAKMRKPMFVIQGKNDPRVPITESEQMVKAIRDQGGVAWYLMAKDEGHGFAKKKNSDFQFLATLLFLNQHLVGAENESGASAQ